MNMGKPKRYSLAELEDMPTLHQGHMENIKYEDERYRVCLSRMTKADGESYDNKVYVSELIEGVWKTIDSYQAR